MVNGLIQLVAYNKQNMIYNKYDLYSLQLFQIDMILQEITNEQFFYKYDNHRNSDQFKILGIIIDLDNLDDNIYEQLSKITLDIHIYEYNENRNKIPEKKNFICSLPLILGKITHVNNSLIIKFCDNIHLSQKKYYNGFFYYEFSIKSPIKFKKIELNQILRYDDHSTREFLSTISDSYYETKHIYSIILKNNQNKLENTNMEKITCDIKIPIKEKILEIYFLIPEQLVEFINRIEIKFNSYSKIITSHELDFIYKIKDKFYVNLYLININSELENLGLENSESVNSFIFEFENDNEEEFDIINNQINNICLYPIILNKLMCINSNICLKYVNGELNNQFINEKNNQIINLYYNNLPKLIEYTIEKSTNTTKNSTKYYNLLNNFYNEYIK